MSPRITIRRATREDAPAVARLLHDFNTEFDEETPGVAALTDRAGRMLDAGEMAVFLGGAGPDGIAQVRYRRSIWSGELDAHLEELYVSPERRGEGIGRALLEAVMAGAREAGATHIDLGTSEDDTAALALYESAGFTNREGDPEKGPRMLYYEREL